MKKKCPKCGSYRTQKNGTQPRRKKGVGIGKRDQSYICTDCWYQWRE